MPITAEAAAAPSEKKAALPKACLFLCFFAKRKQLSLIILSASSASVRLFVSGDVQSFFSTKYASSKNELPVFFR